MHLSDTEPDELGSGTSSGWQGKGEGLTFAAAAGGSLTALALPLPLQFPVSPAALLAPASPSVGRSCNQQPGLIRCTRRPIPCVPQADIT